MGFRILPYKFCNSLRNFANSAQNKKISLNKQFCMEPPTPIFNFFQGHVILRDFFFLFFGGSPRFFFLLRNFAPSFREFLQTMVQNKSQKQIAIFFSWKLKKIANFHNRLRNKISNFAKGSCKKLQILLIGCRKKVTNFDIMKHDFN